MKTKVVVIGTALAVTMGYYLLAGRSSDLGNTEAKQTKVAVTPTTAVQSPEPLMLETAATKTKRTFASSSQAVAMKLASMGLVSDPRITPEQNLKVHDMLSRLHSEIQTKEEIVSSLEEFKTFSSDEVDAYYRLGTSYRMARLADNLKRRGLAYTTAELEDVQDKTELWGQMRIELNRMAQERFGQPSNLISGNQVLALGTELMEDDRFAAIMAQPKPHPVSNDQAALKSSTTKYDSLAIKSLSESMLTQSNTAAAAYICAPIIGIYASNPFDWSGSGTNDYAYGNFSAVGQTDCDWYFLHAGHKNRATWSTSDGAALYATLSAFGRFNDLYNSYSTGLQLGQTRMFTFYANIGANWDIQTKN